VSPAKTTEQIEMPFWWVEDFGGPKELEGTIFQMGVQIPYGKGQF